MASRLPGRRPRNWTELRFDPGGCDPLKPAKNIQQLMPKVLMFSQQEPSGQEQCVLNITVWSFKHNEYVKIDLSPQKVNESKEILKDLIEKLCKVLYFIYHACSYLDISDLFGLHSGTSARLLTKAFTENELREIVQTQTELLHNQTFEAIKEIITKWKTNEAFPRSIFATDGVKQFKETFKEVMLNDTWAIDRFLSPLEEGIGVTPIIQQNTRREVYQWAAGNFILAFSLGLQTEYDGLGSHGRNEKWVNMVSKGELFHIHMPSSVDIPLNRTLREIGSLVPDDDDLSDQFDDPRDFTTDANGTVIPLIGPGGAAPLFGWV